MNYKKVKINIARKINFFVSTAILTISLTTNSYSQECPSLSSSDFIPDSSTLGYSTSYNESFLNQTNIDQSLKDISSTECKNLPIDVNAEPGRNCFYDGKPLCEDIPRAGYDIPSENIISEISLHRYNCHDLSDLPLCSLLTELSLSTAAGKNCALKCSELDKPDGISLTRGEDYAIHNKDCVRFCDELEEERLKDPSLPTDPRCIAKSCHQLGWDQDHVDPIVPNIGDGGNCNILPCNLLYPYELLDTSQKIEDDELAERENIKYCSNDVDIMGNILKCYHFSKDQLQYTLRDKMCVIHNCAPACSTYTSQLDENGDGKIDEKDHDDTLNIISKTESYQNVYSFYQYSCFNPTEKYLCKPVNCLPKVDRQYRCTTDGSTITGTDADIVPNSNCGTSDAESNCNDHFCEKTIDCNILDNQNEPECKSINEDVIGTRSDGDLESWFYRPKPLDRAVQKEGDYTIMDPGLTKDLCYPTEVFKDRGGNFTIGGNILDPTRISAMFQQKYWGGVLKQRIPMISPIPDIVINLGYFHSSIKEDATRAGGMCKFKASDNFGGRGTGQSYLCYREGVGGPLITGGIYQQLSEYTAYHKGYVETTFKENQGAIHKLDVCLRFRNALRPDDGYSETCGSRECAVTCGGAALGCYMQNCGYDRCETLKVEGNKGHDCAMSDTLFGDTFGFEEDKNRECMKVVDDNLRLRAVQVNNYICTFLDVKGVTAYDDNAVDPPIKFATGKETLIDDNGTEYCIDGKPKEGSCNAFDTTKDPWSASVWRTVKLTPNVHIPYIQNNQPQTANFRGFLDRNGRVHLEQNCIKTTNRTAPLDYYNIATINNSPKLFIPPVYIKNARKYIGGPISVPRNIDDKYGVTNFHYPEMEVVFGGTSALLGLNINEEGDENVLTTVSTVVNDSPYSKELFVKKEYDISGNIPLLCLYEKLKSTDGTYLLPYKVGCVEREKPVIDNYFLKLMDPNLPNQKLIITPLSSNTYDDSSISLQYLGSYGNNKLNDNCSGDDECTNVITLKNPDINTPSCDNSVENYQICVQRDECSQLNIECMTNEINMQNAILNGESITDFLATRNWCNDYLLKICNEKLGLIPDPKSNIYNQNPSNIEKHEKAYGWFNELCFKKGPNTTTFDDNLVRVIAFDPSDIPNNAKGKCLIDPNSPYETDNDPNTSCEDGGFAPNCLCVKYVEGVPLNPGHISRIQTPREAGLCIDMPKPEKCPEINYNTIPNTDPETDPDYVSWSLNISSETYGDVKNSDVHFSHELRTKGTGHAEFPVAMMGMDKVEGSCKGFWKNRQSGGIDLPPTRDCKDNSGLASWSKDVSNECIRYSCPQIYTSGIYNNGYYQGGYGINENSQEKGLSNAFALWPYHLQTSDFAENIIANSCIDGFKKSGSTPYNANGDYTITEYIGGTLPSRYCNQLGIWQTPENSCERIKCSAVNVPGNYDPAKGRNGYQLLGPENYYINTVTDTNNNNVKPDFSHGSNPNPVHTLSDYSYTGRYDKDPETGLISNVQWDYWIKSGGAIFFEETLSSRSASFIEDSSKRIGYCNNELGFFQAGTQNPELECDYLGNWVVKNQCVTRCDIVEAVDSEDETNGYSKWPSTEVEITDQTNIENNFEQVSGSCLTASESNQYDVNLLPYPYPPLRNRDGENYKIYYTSSEYYNHVSNMNLGSHLELNKFVSSQESGSIPADVKNDTRFHFLDSSDNVEKWSIPNESLPVGSSVTTSYPEPTRMCKWVKLETGFTTNYWHPADNKCIATCPGGTYDPRLNVGVTEHQKYDPNSDTKTKKFYITWPETTFGARVYATHRGFVSTMDGINASHFTNDPTTNPDGRTGGEYIVSRKCGSDGKWEDPLPYCATNDGLISEAHAKYSGETITGKDIIAVESSTHATGSCFPSSSYYPKDTELGTPQPVSQYSCQYHDANKNIDQVYFKYESGEPCGILCNATADEEFGNAINTLGTRYVRAGEYLNLSCKSGYGHMKSTAPNLSDNSCGGPTVTDRISDDPKILCQSDGSWASAVTFNCDICATCDCPVGNCGASKFLPGYRKVTHYSNAACDDGTDICWSPGSRSKDDYSPICNGGSSNSNDQTINVYPDPTILPMKSGETSIVCARHRKCGNTESTVIGFQCVDGKFLVIKSGGNSNQDFTDFCGTNNVSDDNGRAYKNNSSSHWNYLMNNQTTIPGSN